MPPPSGEARACLACLCGCTVGCARTGRRSPGNAYPPPLPLSPLHRHATRVRGRILSGVDAAGRRRKPLPLELSAPPPAPSHPDTSHAFSQSPSSLRPLAGKSSHIHGIGGIAPPFSVEHSLSLSRVGEHRGWRTGSTHGGASLARMGNGEVDLTTPSLLCSKCFF